MTAWLVDCVSTAKHGVGVGVGIGTVAVAVAVGVGDTVGNGWTSKEPISMIPL